MDGTFLESWKVFMVLSFLQTLQMASESVASVGENKSKGPEK